MKTDALSPSHSRDVARRTHRGRKAFVMCSPKNGRVEIRLESRLEQSVAQALELDPRVRSYRTQPFTLELSSGRLLPERPKHREGAQTFYTPDFVVDVNGLEVVVEVKPEALVERHREWFAHLKGQFLALGQRFVVISEADLPAPYRRNLQLLLPFVTQAHSHLTGWAAPLSVRAPEQLRGPVNQVLAGLTPANYYLGAGLLLGVLRFDLCEHWLEHMDFMVEPAFGSLGVFEVLRYE
ncbi:Tn7 transposase TnsA N-terminal domain-containing protein [Pseudomonas sp. NY15436]|uniref:Tn7 transposase TnsA N-terminal domain-containing protein n=1 Tax=Pseudomonas sp. NY15436 TaxID=3400359 RepID=UPI003A873F81